ncbi:MAG: hypothetical protein QS748_00180 [Candidatus Endonucleobacter bathymodioli]|uniref:Uncharacterized protein n=1 Tax=Candidatus Endonucleibacter bathymodioli TaxID=539814 RepID=A0AA90SRK0_9GAMM|nr:hypothetical protein [Candidatus Endonucleobacter bathymodioli]
MKIVSPNKSIAEILKEDPLRNFFVWWDKINPEDAVNLKNAIDSAPR